MNDRELLELAAKAAGYRVKRTSGDQLVVWIEDAPFVWNPLTDDGEALRLAVKMNFVLNTSKFSTRAWQLMPGSVERAEDNGGDPYAATRRAIVRAAAEIGKGMP